MESGISEPADVSTTPPLAQQSATAASAAASQPDASTAAAAAWRSPHHRSQADRAKLSAAVSLFALRQYQLSRQEQDVEIALRALSKAFIDICYVLVLMRAVIAAEIYLIKQ